jgi:excisionase family DNA binding protein
VLANELGLLGVVFTSSWHRSDSCRFLRKMPVFSRDSFVSPRVHHYMLLSVVIHRFEGDQMPAQIEPRLLRPTEVAAALGVSRSKVYELIGRGSLRSVRVDGARRISAQALDEFVRKLEAETSSRDEL